MPKNRGFCLKKQSVKKILKKFKKSVDIYFSLWYYNRAPKNGGANGP